MATFEQATKSVNEKLTKTQENNPVYNKCGERQFNVTAAKITTRVSSSKC